MGKGLDKDWSEISQLVGGEVSLDDLKLPENLEHGPRITKTEALILKMIHNNGPMYGNEIVKKSEGTIKKGSVFVLLGRLVEKGILEATNEKEGVVVYWFTNEIVRRVFCVWMKLGEVLEGSTD